MRDLQYEIRICPGQVNMNFYASEFTFKSTIFFSQLQGARWISAPATPDYIVQSNAYNVSIMSFKYIAVFSY